MRVCVITGSYPPQVCGVGDYTRQLRDALQEAGEDVLVFHRKDWSLAKLAEHIRELRATAADVFLLQYPTEGYGYSLVPQLLMFGLLGKRRVVALHEYKRKSFKGKLATYLFFLSGASLVFTNKLDASFAKRSAPWLRRAAIIPIGSNIPWGMAAAAEFDLAYFGLIRPHKGIEEFIEKARDFKKHRPNASIVMIGDIPSGYEDYAESTFRAATLAGIAVKSGLGMQDVATILGRTKICFFPFADGLSERRGSVLAALGNGCLVVGTGLEAGLSPEFERSVAVTTDELDLPKIFDLNESGAFDEVKKNAGIYCGLRSWDRVAKEHARILRGGRLETRN